MQYLDKHLPGGMMPQQRSEEWQSLFTYRNSLSQGDGEVHPITLKQASQRRYANKRKQMDGKANTLITLNSPLTNIRDN